MNALTDTYTDTYTEDAAAIASLAALHLLAFASPGARHGALDEIGRARWYFDRLMSYAPEGDAKCQS
jgi:hypothetical protein